MTACRSIFALRPITSSVSAPDPSNCHQVLLFRFAAGTLLAVGLLETIAAMLDRERTIRVRGDLYGKTGVVLCGRVGDEGFAGVVILAAFVGEVKLPEVFEAGGFLDCRPGFEGAAFVCAVIHDGDTRVKGVDDQGGTRSGGSVVCRHV